MALPVSFAFVPLRDPAVETNIELLGFAKFTAIQRQLTQNCWAAGVALLVLSDSPVLNVNPHNAVMAPPATTVGRVPCYQGHYD
jgi:hypothetical protein